MKNLYSYLEKNKDVCLKDKKWNMMDDLLCACIAYIPLTNDFTFKTFDTLCNDVLNYKYPANPEYVSYTNKKIFTILKNSKRYKQMYFFNFKNVVDDKTQFAAITCQIGSKKIISFKGSDGTKIGWMENLRLAYSYPTYTHTLAIKYLRQNVHILDYDVHVIGHSKGGNLAVVASMETPWYKAFRIKKIYNFDGPGLKDAEYQSKKYRRIARKITTILPNKSYIGSIMYNDNIKVIKTNAMMIGVHYPTNWQIANDSFVYDELSHLSNKIHMMTTKMVKDIDEHALMIVMEEVFKVLSERQIDKRGITLLDIRSIVRGINSAPEKEKKYLFSLIKTMFALENDE